MVVSRTAISTLVTFSKVHHYLYVQPSANVSLYCMPVNLSGLICYILQLSFTERLNEIDRL